MHFDAITIGGSFAGLSAAIHLARARRSVCIIDSGLPRNRFASESHGFFGFDGATPASMIATARSQVLEYPTVTWVDGEAVSAHRESAGRFVVELATGETQSASKVIIASGVIDTLPHIEGVTERWGKSVLHCPYCHGYEFAGKQLGVLRVHPLSIHQAMLIPEWGPTTYFLNGATDIEPEEAEQLRHLDVTIEPGAIAAIEGTAPSITGVRMTDGKLVALDALFLAPSTSISPIAEGLGCALENGPAGPYIQTDETRMTAVPGVYAAGDAATMRWNATLASADGVIAGTSVHRAFIMEATASR